MSKLVDIAEAFKIIDDFLDSVKLPSLTPEQLEGIFYFLQGI